MTRHEKGGAPPQIPWKQALWKLFVGGMALLVLTVSAWGDEIEYDITEELEEIGAEELYGQLPSETQQLLEEFGIEEISPETLLSLEPGKFFQIGWAYLKDQIKKPVATMGTILAAVLLLAFLETTKTAFWDGALTPVFGTVAVLTVAAAVADPIIGCITQAAQAVRDCSLFLISFIPAFAGVLTAGGQPVTATTYNLFLFGTCQVLSRVMSAVIVPCLGVYLAFCLVGSAAPELHITSAASSLKSLVTWAMGLLLSIFVGLLSIQSVVASGADSVTAKTAKFLIGSFIPVVGGALSDAYLAAQGCIRLLKTTLGGFGILVAAVTFLPVLLKTTAWYLMVHLVSLAGDTAALHRAAGLRVGPGAFDRHCVLFCAVGDHLHIHHAGNGGYIMDGIREWGYSLCAAAIACGMIQVLIPNAGAGRVMRMTVSVFFLCCLFSPLVLRVPELAEIPQSTAQAKADEIARRLAEGQEERAIGRAQEDLRREARDSLEEIGIFPSKIQITIHAVDKSRIEISELILVLQESDREREGEAVQRIKDLLGEAPDIQYERNEANEPEGDEGTPEPFVAGG
ncbi:stage III sporulation protein AF [uncultured Merdimmobilis sp.]|nr:stage III sporulation protein AF [uncultured Merdimmobilis sp.]